MTKSPNNNNNNNGERDGVINIDDEMRRGPWILEEDNLLIGYVTCHGEGRWNSLAKSAGLKRSGKSCRLRWLNYLKPDVKRGNLTPQEQLLILQLHSQLGNRWSKIAQHLPGRTDNEIKNYWRTRVQKQARQLQVDSNSKKFVEAIHSLWKPRLLEKMKQVEDDQTPSLLPQSPHPDPVKLRNNIENIGDDFHHVPEHGLHDISFPGCHVADIDWFGDELGEGTCYFLEHD